MKQLEAHKQDNVLQMQKRDERRQKIREKMSHTVANIEVEKQLKKLATKGGKFIL